MITHEDEVADTPTPGVGWPTGGSSDDERLGARCAGLIGLETLRTAWTRPVVPTGSARR